MFEMFSYQRKGGENEKKRKSRRSPGTAVSYSYNNSHLPNTPARCLHTLSLQILILGSIVSIYTGGNQSSVRLNDCRYQS